MRSRPLYLFVGLLLAVGLAAGCQPQDGADGNGETTGTAEATQTLQLDVVQQWLETNHASAVTFAAEREFCVSCHDGGGFAQNTTDPATLERDFVVAVDCRACHTGQGVELAQQGSVSIPTTQTVQMGNSALCGGCHHALREPDPQAEERNAPHHSVQTDVWAATDVAMQFEGAEYIMDGPHTEIENPCISCHMATGEEGVPEHTFQPDNFESCTQEGCHEQQPGPQDPAMADYDGDGNTEPFQDEVDGLITMLREEINNEINGTFEGREGRIVFTDEDSQTIQPSEEVYKAAYNTLLADYDGSMGMHNPHFVVSMLQGTWSALTGEPFPGAAIGEEASQEASPPAGGQETTP